MNMMQMVNRDVSVVAEPDTSKKTAKPPVLESSPDVPASEDSIKTKKQKANDIKESRKGMPV